MGTGLVFNSCYQTTVWEGYTLHGYHNSSEKPLHILVFATPENNLSVYNQRELPVKNQTHIRLIEKLPTNEKIFLDRVLFSSTPPSDFSNSLMLNLENRIIDFNPCKVECNDDNLYITFKIHK